MIPETSACEAVRPAGFEDSSKASGKTTKSDLGGPTGGANDSDSVGPIALSASPADSLNIRPDLVGQATLDADAFTHALFLAECGFLVGAAATARTAIEARLRAALRSLGRHYAPRGARIESRRWINIACTEGLIDFAIRCRLFQIYNRLSRSVHGGRIDASVVAERIREAATLCEGISVKPPPTDNCAKEMTPMENRHTD